VTLIEKLLAMAKRTVEWLEEQNETFTKIAHKQQVELQWSIEKIRLL
jgi:hypothetical protein